jgi:hypothetical protein
LPLSASNIVQNTQATTSPNFPTTVTVSLPQATAGGTVLIGFTGDELASAAPSGFVTDKSVTSGAHSLYLWRRQTSNGETSWDVPMAAAAMAAWWVWEVTGLDPNPVDVTTTGAFGTATSRSTGTSPTTTATDELLVATWCSWNSADATITWSGQTSGFTEQHDTSTTNAGTTEVSISAAWLFPGVTGAYASTATASASALLAGLLVGYKAVGPPPTTIAQVPIGGSFAMTAKVTGRTTSTSLDLYTADSTVQGSIAIDGALAVTGTMARALDQIGVSTAGLPFAVNDIVKSATTGEVMVVRDVWTDAAAGALWSNTTDRRTRYSTTGWTRIGAATIS